MTFNDLFTILGGTTLTALSAVVPMMSAFFRRPAVDYAANGEITGFSIIITTHNDAERLARNLPLLLSQDYEGNFEVVVVDESSTDDTCEVLKALERKYANLYATYIPDSSHYVSRRKLALTLGVKASKYPWLVFTDVSAVPCSDQWLKVLSNHCDAQTDIVWGYTGYKDEGTSAFQRFEHLLLSCHLQRFPYRYEGQNLAVRKSVFLAHNGFLKNLMYLRGEYDFMVNEYRQKGRLRLMNTPDGRVLCEAPSQKEWDTCRLALVETRRHLKHRFWPDFLVCLDNLLLHLSYWLQLSAIAFGAVFGYWLLFGIAIVCLLFTVVARTVVVKRAASEYAVKLPTLLVPFLELRFAWSHLHYKLAHRMADKYDFIRR